MGRRQKKREPELFRLKSKRRRLKLGFKPKKVSLTGAAKSFGGSARKFRLKHFQKKPGSIYD